MYTLQFICEIVYFLSFIIFMCRETLRDLPRTGKYYTTHKDLKSIGNISND